MIECRQVSKRYPGGHAALQDITFSLSRGEMAFLTGPSGAGKSTLMKLLALIERPSGGEVVVNGRCLNRALRRHVALHRRLLGIIFQDFRLLADRTVYDNVALPLQISGEYGRLEIGRRVRAALDKVGLLAKERYYPPELAGGEQQRVGVARAVVHKPCLLLADEPTGNLDATAAKEIMALFEDFHRVGVTVLIATHDADLVARLSHRALALENGRLTEGAADAR